MAIDWFKFVAALLLLLTPSALFHGPKVRFRPISGEWEKYWAQIFTLGAHAIDLARAATGAWLLAAALQTLPGTRSLLRQGVVITEAVVLVFAVTLQTLVCRGDRGEANAPFAFLIGLVLGFVPPVIAGFGLVLAIVAAAGSRVPAAFFPLLAVTVPGMGYLFSGKKFILNLAVVTCCALTPWLLSLLFSRDLVIAYRARRADESRLPTSDSPYR